jgi:hypothetical protein
MRAESRPQDKAPPYVEHVMIDQVRALRHILIVAALGAVSAVLVAWGFATWQTVPMYAGTPAAILPRPRGGVFLQWDRPWSANEIPGFGFTDRWWSDLRAGGWPEDEQKEAAVLVANQIAERATRLAGPRYAHVAYSDAPPSWGTFAQATPPPDGFIVGSDTAFGWPLPCLWHQVIGKLAGDMTVGYSTAGAELRGGILLRGELDSRGHDYHAIPLRPICTPLLINVTLYALAWWLLLFGTRHLRGFSRRHRGACPACGYDLQRDRARGCPECGWNRAAPPTASTHRR